MKAETALKILLIDDHALVRDTLTRMLESLGHTVVPAASGREGLAQLETYDGVDLVLTDIQMPGMSGPDVVKTVHARWPHVRVGLISGAPELLHEHRETVDLVILKPAGFEALQGGLSQLVHVRQVARQNSQTGDRIEA